MVTRHGMSLGSKIGPRIAMLVSQAMVITHAKLAGLKHMIAMHIFHAISDEISEEVDVTLGPFLRRLMDETPEDHPARPSVEFMHNASGQLKALAGTGLQITGLLGTVSAIINNSLAPYVYNIVSQSPGQLPDNGTVVNAYVTGMVGADEARGDLAGLGIQFGWADRMLELGFNYPDFTVGIALMQRGIIDEVTFRRWGRRNGFKDTDLSSMLALRTVPLSPADLALAVLRGNMDKADGERKAAESGVPADDFAVLLGNTGEPPGLMQLLEGYRRGLIDKATLEKGILESRYRNEWIPMLLDLRYEPMTVSDAVNASVQNQLSAEEARRIADINGLQPGHFDTLAATAGEPLSRTEMEQLYNRGLATEEQVKQASRESRLKNKYNDLAFALHTRLLPTGTIIDALRYGAITQDRAIGLMMEYGYSKADATAAIMAGLGRRLQTYRDEALRNAATLYQDGIMPLDDVSKLAESVGHTAEEVKFIAQAADFRREAHLITTVTSAIKAKYLQHHITVNEASGLLDQAGISATERDYLIKLWQIEHSAFTRVLTPAQIVKAVTKELIQPDDGLAKLTALGYSEEDATLLLEGA